MGIGIYPRSQFVHIDVRPPPSYRWIDYSAAELERGREAPAPRLEAQEAPELSRAARRFMPGLRSVRTGPVRPARGLLRGVKFQATRRVKFRHKPDEDRALKW